MLVDVMTIMDNGAPLLPPMDAGNGYCLHFNDAGTLRGGYSLLCHAPQEPNTVLVRVECSETVYAQMIDDPVLDIQWWEEVPNAEQ